MDDDRVVAKEDLRSAQARSHRQLLSTSCRGDGGSNVLEAAEALGAIALAIINELIGR